MKKMFFGLVGLSALFFQLRASTRDEALFTERVLMTLYGKPCPGRYDTWYDLGRSTFFLNGPFDIDQIELPTIQKSKLHCTTLGELLEAASEEKIDLFKGKKHSSLLARSILAYTSYSRSQKSLYYDPVEMLRRLINNAIFLPVDKEMEPIDWTDQAIDLNKVDPEWHYQRLITYFSSGFFGGYYDLSKISIRWNGGETIYSYLKRESQTNVRVKRVFDLLEGLSKLVDENESFLPVPEEELAYFNGTVPADFFTVPASGNAPTTQVGQKPASFFTLPRILMGLGIGLIAGYFIYKHYYAEPKDEVDESIRSKNLLAETYTAVPG